jgi:hypothetical protein
MSKSGTKSYRQPVAVHGVDMRKIVDASYAVWRLDKLSGARVAWTVPEVRPTWQLRWRCDFAAYASEQQAQKGGGGAAVSCAPAGL